MTLKAVKTPCAKIFLRAVKMIYIPTGFLKPNMVLARDISAYGSMFALLNKGQKLTASLIERLVSAQIPGVYIENGIADDIQPNEILAPAYKEKVISEMKTIFASCEHGETLTSRTLMQGASLAEDLVMKILNQDVYLVDVITIKDYDNYTYSHCMYVAMFSVLMGIQLKYTQQQLNELALCGLMHDIGKVDISLDIINKKGRLTEAEFAEIKTHPLRSIERLRHNQQLTQRVFNGISCHHEKFDGTGYPYGLKGDKIHIYARILALADVYDALTSNRSYRRAWTSAEAIEYIMSQSGIHFDFDLVSCFMRTVAAYPIGSLVKLSNGLVALVVRNNVENTLRPVVRIVTEGSGLTVGTDIDLTRDTKYLNLTIISTISAEDFGELPAAITAGVQIDKKAKK